MKQAKVLITVSSLLLFILACEKDSTDVTYGVTYMKSEVQPFSEVQYYSSNGKINVQAINTDWYFNDTGRFSYLSNYVMAPGFHDSLRFNNPKEAISKYYNSETKYDVEKIGSTMILTEKELRSYYTSSNDEYTRSPQYYLLQYKPEVVDEWLISSTRGAYLFGYSGKQKYVAIESGGKVILPLIYYSQRRSGLPLASYFLNNNLQKDFYKDIMPGDTVSVMEARLIYKQK